MIKKAAFSKKNITEKNKIGSLKGRNAVLISVKGPFQFYVKNNLQVTNVVVLWQFYK